MASKPPTFFAKQQATLNSHNWDWVGTAVTNSQDISTLNARQVYGLTPTTSKPYCANKYEVSGHHSCDEGSQVSNPDAIIPDNVSIDGSDVTHTNTNLVENKLVSGPKIMKTAPSTLTKCNTKCRDNPNCLSNLGQELWEAEDAFKSYCKAQKLLGYDPSEERRDPDLPVGLRNLGATCYVNSLLQVWFHDQALRRGVFACESKAHGVDKKSPIHHLQHVFAYLHQGNRNVYNPGHFVESLQLSTCEQQDAQEFCKLLMSLLEMEFAAQPHAHVRSLIKDQFEGAYAYGTRCKRCNNISLRDCSFYELELQIKDNSTLQECIQEYLKPEMLEGANQYLCPTCRSMQDAERSIHLKSLPPVLNIQLLRFIYDTTSLTKKKIKRTVRFPKTVDMREFIDIDHCGDAAGKRKRPRTDDGYGDNSRVEDNETKDTSDDEFIYDLTAVLIHNGPSAYSGHFIAHVFDESRKTWFKLDDETVTRLEPNEEFDPDKEKEVPVDKKQPATAGQVKKPRGKGKGKLADDQSQSEKSNQQDQGTQAKETVIMHSSRNAYMLAYTRRSHRRNLTLDACPPPWAGKAVEAANLGFEQDVEEYKQKMESLRDDFERKRMERRSFYTMWNVKSNEDASYYVAADALRTWLHDDFGVSPDVMQNTKARKPEDNDMKVMTDEKRCEEGMVAVASDNDIPMTDLHPALANDRISVDGDVENGRAILMEIDTENEIGYVSKGDCISDETDPKDNKTFDNATITCEHGNLDPLALGKAKRIREEAGERLFTEYGYVFQPLLTSQHLCRECVKELFEDKLYSIKHPKDVDLFLKREREKTKLPKQYFWISKEWLREWKKKTPRFHIVHSSVDPRPDADPWISHVKCKHGALTLNDRNRENIPKSAYEYLQQLFPGLECFTNATDVCEACQSLEEMKLEDTKEYREQAEIERNELKSLLNSNKNTRIHGGTSYRLIEKDFLDAWRRFIRNPNNSQRPGMIDNSQFLCADHNKLVYDLNIAEDATCGEFEIIQQDEWDYVIALYKGGPDITLMQMDKVNVEGQEETKSDSRIITVPELCEGCRMKRKLDYEEGTIFIRKTDITTVHGHQQEVDRKVCAGSTSSSEELANSYDHEHHSFRNNVCSDVIIPNNNGNQPSHILGVEQGGGEDDDDDAADATYRVSSTTSRATRSGRGPQAHKGGRGRIKKTVTRKQRVTVLGPTRRSKRLKRNTGDGTGKADGQMVKVTMNKDDTVKALKVKIMDQLKIVPIYQRLFLEKRELEDNDVTMGQLGVVPGTTIDLVEFEEGEDEGDVVAADDWSQVHKVEGGFKGTGLVGLLFNNGGEGGPVASGTSGSIGWSCSVCTFVNYSEQSVCQICDSPK